MKQPDIQGLQERQIIIYYRINESAVRPVLPAGLSPRLLQGSALLCARISFYRNLRPKGFWSFLHRSTNTIDYSIAVNHEATQNGFFRFWQEASAPTHILGVEILPGPVTMAKFTYIESNGGYYAEVHGKEGKSQFSLSARETEKLPAGSVFKSAMEAEGFSENPWMYYGDKNGYSARQLTFESLKLKPLEIFALHTPGLAEKIPAAGIPALQPDSIWLAGESAIEWQNPAPVGK